MFNHVQQIRRTHFIPQVGHPSSSSSLYPFHTTGFSLVQAAAQIQAPQPKKQLTSLSVGALEQLLSTSQLNTFVAESLWGMPFRTSWSAVARLTGLGDRFEVMWQKKSSAESIVAGDHLDCLAAKPASPGIPSCGEIVAATV